MARERSDENGMVIVSRGNACAPPYPTICICSEGVKQKRRTRRAEGEGADGSRTPKRATVSGGGLRFFVPDRIHMPNPKPFLTLPAVSEHRDSECSGGAVKHTQTPETHSTARRGHNAVAAKNQRNKQTNKAKRSNALSQILSISSSQKIKKSLQSFVHT